MVHEADALFGVRFYVAKSTWMSPYRAIAT